MISKLILDSFLFSILFDLKAPISPEDVSINKFLGGRGEIKVNHSHPEVERVRR